MAFSKLFLGCVSVWVLLQGNIIDAFEKMKVIPRTPLIGEKNFTGFHSGHVRYGAGRVGIDSHNFMIKNILQSKCLQVPKGKGKVSLVDCKPLSLHQQWTRDPSSGSIMNAMSRQCLTVEKAHEFSSLTMQPCEHADHQTWSCDKLGHLHLKGHELYLGTKPGNKKVYLSKDRDKYSRWETELGLPVCRAAVMSTVRYQDKTTETMQEVNKEVSESTLTSATETMNVLPRISYVGETALTVTSTSPGERNQQFHSANGNLIESDYETVQHGRGWHMAMLILCPFALMLGGMILTMNIRSNKKRKLSALPSNSRSLLKGGPVYIQCPASEKPLTAECVGKDPDAGTLRHGEIMIEWKDGTVTPLFDPQQN